MNLLEDAMAEEKIIFFLTREEAENIAFILHTYKEPLRLDDEDPPRRKEALRLGNIIAEQLSSSRVADCSPKSPVP